MERQMPHDRGLEGTLLPRWQHSSIDFSISVITIQVSMAVSPLTHRNGPADPKIHRRTAKDPEEPKQSWKKRNKAGDFTLFTFKVYNKATRVKTVWCCRIQK